MKGDEMVQPQTASGSGGARPLAAMQIVAVMLAGVAVLLGAAACASQASDALVVTVKANDATVTLAKGGTVTVKLAENPTTGYQWTMIVGPGLSLVSSTFVAPSASGPVGAGGTHVWVVKAEQAGTRTLTGVYKRSWSLRTRRASRSPSS